MVENIVELSCQSVLCCAKPCTGRFRATGELLIWEEKDWRPKALVHQNRSAISEPCTATGDRYPSADYTLAFSIFLQTRHPVLAHPPSLTETRAIFCVYIFHGGYSLILKHHLITVMDQIRDLLNKMHLYQQMSPFLANLYLTGILTTNA